jgi:hypothetical protein
MNKIFIGLIAACSMSVGVNAFADSAKECEKLKDEYNLIYAAKGFCFKDPDAKAKFGNENCNTTKPKFSEKEQQKLDEIKARQKELNCK